MKQYTCKVGDLRRAIRESSQQFKPVIGSNVKSEDEKNNREAYKDIEKETEKFIPSSGTSNDNKELDNPFNYQNRTLLHLNPRTEPTDDYKKRVEAQAMGKDSYLAKDIDDEASGVDTTGNKRIYDAVKKSADDINDNRAEIAHRGLTAREGEKEEFKKKSLTENRKPKRLVFKYTRFVNESQMLSRIPEEYKQDGQTIHMVDKLGNEYIVECEENSHGVVETNIKSYVNRNVLNEQVSRINELMGYKAGNGHSEEVRKTHINESRDFNDMFDLIRKSEK